MLQPRAGSPAAAAAIWNPVPEPDGAGRAEELRQARRRGLRQAALACGFALLLFFLWSPWVALIVASVAALLLASSQLSPVGLYARIERAFAALGHWTGELLSTVSLFTVFCTIFLPFGLLFRRGARDPMKRRYQPDAESYWQDREPAPASGHQRQF